ncbi:hypothetical protein FQN51_007310 [Onygenales sp. PD_10]|nr:hypothetical protein FQN51_007310 [Onygenales sp. PD_10]
MSVALPASTAITILVWRKTDGLDYKKSRHTGLLLRKNQEIQGGLVHATNTDGPFRVEADYGYNPLTSNSLAGAAQVGVINKHVDVVMAIVQHTPVRNDLDEWNCQNWVGDALQRLVGFGWITAEQRMDGIDGMADLLAQAPDG